MGDGRVIQAFFQERKPPAAAPLRRFVRTLLPAQTHLSTPAPRQAQPAFIDPRLVVPHAAQRASRSGLPPHPATLPGNAVGRTRTAQRLVAPHAASLQPKAAVRAFRTPEGFLGGQRRGEALPPAVKQQMEGYFDADFSDVRVHVGPEAGSIGALAFTVGTDLYFAPDQYQPHTQYGRELIGHELTHVVQQRDGRVGNPFGKGVAVVHDEELEAEADRHGRAAARALLFPGRPGAGSRGFGRGQSAQASSGGGARGAYQLVVGAYMHDAPQPEALAGHSFVAIESPDGDRRAFGFSPAHYGNYDPSRDLGRLRAGVEGVVHDDAAAFDKPGVKTQAYPITPDQARAAMAKVSEYQSGRYRYSADRRQCGTFVADVMHAAGVATEPIPQRPRIFYEAMDDRES
jgi:hypothetical protein